MWPRSAGVWADARGLHSRPCPRPKSDCRGPISEPRSLPKRPCAAREMPAIAYACRKFRFPDAGWDFVDRPDVGEHVWVKFDGLEAIEATVCWIAGFKAGLKYTKPIHPAVFDLLLTRVRR